MIVKLTLEYNYVRTISFKYVDWFRLIRGHTHMMRRLSYLSSSIEQKPVVTQLVKKFHTFFGTWRLITVFTRAMDRIISKLNRHHTHVHSLFKSVLILSFILHVYFSSERIPSRFQLKIFVKFLFYQCMLHDLPIRTSLFWPP